MTWLARSSQIFKFWAKRSDFVTNAEEGFSVFFYHAWNGKICTGSQKCNAEQFLQESQKYNLEVLVSKYDQWIRTRAVNAQLYFYRFSKLVKEIREKGCEAP